MESASPPAAALPPHLLFIAYPSQGHAISLLHLAKRLASRSHVAITYVCSQIRVAKLESEHASGPGLDPRIRLVGLPEDVPLAETGVDEGLRSAIWVWKVAQRMEAAVVGLLREMHHRSPVSAATNPDAYVHPAHSLPPSSVFSDAFLPWVADVASTFNMGHFAFFPCPASTLAVILNTPFLVSHGHTSSQPSLPHQLIAIPGLPPFLSVDLPSFLREHEPMERFQTSLDCAYKLIETPTILVNTTYEMEAKYIDYIMQSQNLNTKRRVLSIGPVFLGQDHPLAMAEYQKSDLTPDCLAWLDSKAVGSVLYVSFGSIHIPSSAEIAEIALGLEASCCDFVWVLRRPPSSPSPHAGNSDVSDLLPEGYLSRLKDRCFIVSLWAPQLLVLSHPSVGGFLTHCGWNSTFESIVSGVPLIAHPQFAEQRLNCRMIVDQLKIGVELEKDQKGMIRRDHLQRAVDLLMEEEKGKHLKQNAADLKDVVRRSMDEGGSSYQNLESVVEQVFAESAKSREIAIPAISE